MLLKSKKIQMSSLNLLLQLIYQIIQINNSKDVALKTQMIKNTTKMLIMHLIVRLA